MDVGARAHLSEVNAHARSQHYFVCPIYIYVYVPGCAVRWEIKKIAEQFFQIISHIARILR